MNTNIWRTKDGRDILIKDMENSHLINTAKMLERHANEAYAAELADTELTHFSPSYYIHDTYNDIRKEIEDRKLLFDSNLDDWVYEEDEDKEDEQYKDEREDSEFDWGDLPF